MKHTNLPWRFQMLGSEGGRIYPDYGDIRERGKFIAVVNGRSTQEDQANGDFIVKAVNVHHELVEALEALCRHSENVNSAFYGDGTVKAMREAMKGQRALLTQAREALTKAKGGQA